MHSAVNARISVNDKINILNDLAGVEKMAGRQAGKNDNRPTTITAFYTIRVCLCVVV